MDGAGSAYVTGYTHAQPISRRPQGPSRRPPPAATDAFVTKLNATGSGLVYSTYLGGSGTDFGFDIAVDGAGSAYVTGCTTARPISRRPQGPPRRPTPAAFRRLCDQAERDRIRAGLFDLPGRRRR